MVQTVSLFPLLKKGEKLKAGLVFKKDNRVFQLKENEIVERKPSSSSRGDNSPKKPKEFYVSWVEAKGEKTPNSKTTRKDSLKLPKTQENEENQGRNSKKSTNSKNDEDSLDKCIIQVQGKEGCCSPATGFSLQIKTKEESKEDQAIIKEKEADACSSLGDGTEKLSKPSSLNPFHGVPGHCLWKKGKNSQNTSIISGKASTSQGISFPFFGPSTASSPTERFSSSNESRRLMAAQDIFRVDDLMHFLDRNQAAHLSQVISSLRAEYDKKIDDLQRHNRDLLSENENLRKRLIETSEKLEKALCSTEHEDKPSTQITSPKGMSPRIPTFPSKPCYFSKKEIPAPGSSFMNSQWLGNSANISLKNVSESLRDAFKISNSLYLRQNTTSNREGSADLKETQQHHSVSQNHLKKFWTAKTCCSMGKQPKKTNFFLAKKPQSQNSNGGCMPESPKGSARPQRIRASNKSLSTSDMSKAKSSFFPQGQSTDPTRQKTKETSKKSNHRVLSLFSPFESLAVRPFGGNSKKLKLSFEQCPKLLLSTKHSSPANGSKQIVAAYTTRNCRDSFKGESFEKMAWGLVKSARKREKKSESFLGRTPATSKNEGKLQKRKVHDKNKRASQSPRKSGNPERQPMAQVGQNSFMETSLLSAEETKFPKEILEVKKEGKTNGAQDQLKKMLNKEKDNKKVKMSKRLEHSS